MKDLKQFPIKLPTDNAIFVEKADLMISLNKELHEKKDKFLKLLQHEYELKKISKKLQKYWELDFDEFVKQLKGKDLSLDKKSELMEFFDKNKIQAVELKEKIDVTDREIDQMVFDLYGLTEDEREIVLNN